MTRQNEKVICDFLRISGNIFKNFPYFFFTDEVGVALTVGTCNQKVAGLNFARDMTDRRSR